MLAAKKADLCSKCLVTEPLVRSFIRSRSFADSFSCSRSEYYQLMRAAFHGFRPSNALFHSYCDFEDEVFASPERLSVRGRSRSEAGDGILFQSISIFSIFGPLSLSHALIGSPTFSP